MRRNIVLLAAAALTLAGCDFDDIASFGNAHAFEKEFHQHYPLKSGGRLSLESFNGSVEITGWDQESVEVDGVQYGSTERLRDAINIDVVASGDSVTIRTIRPVDARGSMGVKYVIKAPRRVNLDRIVTSNGAVRVNEVEGLLRVRTSNGSVNASRLRGDVEVVTSNGSVNVRELDGPIVIRTSNGHVQVDEIRGALQATTSNASIDARLRRPEPHRPVKLSSSNGHIQLTMDTIEDNEVRASTSNSSITLKIPAQVRARIDARTSHGSIHSDFSVNHEIRESKSRVEGTIGGGGPTLELSTSNGSIHLLKL